MCLETGYSILHKLNTCKSQKVLIFGLKLANTCVLPLALACTLYVCTVSTRVQVEQLSQRNCSSKQHHSTLSFNKTIQSCTVYQEPALGSSRMNLIMTSAANNELLVSLKVDFRQFCAWPSREWRYKVSSAIFRLSDRLQDSNRDSVP